MTRALAGLLVDAAGWAGAGCLLLAYALLSAGRIPAGLRYQLLNLAGSVGLALNGVAHRAWPSAALNIVWLAVGLAALRAWSGRPGRPSWGLTNGSADDP
jgi:hypothetical protein